MNSPTSNIRVFLAMQNGLWNDPGVQEAFDAAASGGYFDPKEWCSDRQDLLTIVTRLRTDKAFERNPPLLSPEKAASASLNLIRCGFLGNDKPGRTCAIHIAALHLLRDPMLELLNAGVDPLLPYHDGTPATFILETHHGPGPGEEPEPIYEEMMAAMRGVLSRRAAHQAINELHDSHDDNKDNSPRDMNGLDARSALLSAKVKAAAKAAGMEILSLEEIRQIEALRKRRI